MKRLPCKPIICGDETRCDTCSLRWDTGYPEPACPNDPRYRAGGTKGPAIGAIMLLAALAGWIMAGMFFFVWLWS